jgi:hypothetical protein
MVPEHIHNQQTLSHMFIQDRLRDAFLHSSIIETMGPALHMPVTYIKKYPTIYIYETVQKTHTHIYIYIYIPIIGTMRYPSNYAYNRD